MDSRFKIAGPSQPLDRDLVSSSPSDHLRRGPEFFRGRNVFGLIAGREISPRTKHIPKRHWGEASKRKPGSSLGSQSETTRDPKRALLSWVEAESLRHLAAKYCPISPSPRSTIAAAFSCDGSILASTHGDHTVKIIEWKSGICLKVLNGHRRTPWVVRFHPSRPELLASGSLDHEVRLWDAHKSVCIGSFDFHRPIASICFHAKGELLAVASGHKLYIWNYIDRTAPSIVLRTRRSLRAVHFHPHAAPFLLTAEVNDIDSSDASMTRATSIGYLRYPPPAVFVANFHSSDGLSFAAELAPISLPILSEPSFYGDDSRIEQQRTSHNVSSNNTQLGVSASLEIQPDANLSRQYQRTESHMETLPSLRNASRSGVIGTADGFLPTNSERLDVGVVGDQESVHSQNPLRFTEFAHLHPTLPVRDNVDWELPFLQGWLMGRKQASLPSTLAVTSGNDEHSAQFMSSFNLISHLATHNMNAVVSSFATPGSTSLYGVSSRSSMQHHFSNLHLPVSESRNVPTPVTQRESGNPQPVINRIESELATSLAAASAAELPCTVKLRIWSYDMENCSSLLTAERCRLIIPHAVLCSEMGAHFSPCGRFLAACVACMLPHIEADSGSQTLVHQDPGVATSPTRHPISAHQVIYELRIYSLEESTFGSVLVSRAIRAAHCLTSIQFSPTSEHILLAYGRRNCSLLKSVVVDGETTLPIYTVLEVYRVADMELVKVLPSAEDEVNVACFHPSAGTGLVYGTKEGKLRILHYDGAYGEYCTRPN